MNQIDNLNLQLDILHDLILENLGNISDCKTRKVLIDLFKFQMKSTQLIIEYLKQGVTEND
jgi:hypothetical protein